MPAKTKGRVCKVKDCGKQHLAKGLCSLHYYEQWRRNQGVPERGAPKPLALEFKISNALCARFERLVPFGERSEFMRDALEEKLSRLERMR